MRGARLPFATAITFVLTAAAFAWSLGRWEQAREILALDAARFNLVNAVTYTLVHAGYGHLLMNLALLAGFGAYVEARTGPWRWLALYVGGAIAAAIGHAALVQPEGVLAGASGAVAALTGAASVYAYQESRRDLWTRLIRLAAPIWVLVQVFSAVRGVLIPGQSVAHWAHLSGFAFGLVVAALWRPRPGALLHRAKELIERGRAAEAVPLLEGSARQLDRQGLELLTTAWEALGDTEKAAQSQAQLVRRAADPPALERLAALGGLALLPPELRMELCGRQPPLPHALRTRILETFLGEDRGTPHRPAALLQLADMLSESEPARSRELLTQVMADYPGTGPADIASARTRP
jgi:membrane associated rhomboid family serine protease